MTHHKMAGRHFFGKIFKTLLLYYNLHNIISISLSLCVCVSLSLLLSQAHVIFELSLLSQVRKGTLSHTKSLVLSAPVWPDEGIKSSQIFPKSCSKAATSNFIHIVTLFKDPNSFKIFGLLLQENLSLRRFNNCPIWSHWSVPVLFYIHPVMF